MKQHSIDECPVRVCGALVPGADAAEIFEGTEFECTRGHLLVAVVFANRAWLVKVPHRFTPKRRPEHRP